MHNRNAKTLGYFILPTNSLKSTHGEWCNIVSDSCKHDIGRENHDVGFRPMSHLRVCDGKEKKKEIAQSRFFTGEIRVSLWNEIEQAAISSLIPFEPEAYLDYGIFQLRLNIPGLGINSTLVHFLQKKTSFFF